MPFKEKRRKIEAKRVVILPAEVSFKRGLLNESTLGRFLYSGSSLIRTTRWLFMLSLFFVMDPPNDDNEEFKDPFPVTPFPLIPFPLVLLLVLLLLFPSKTAMTRRMMKRKCPLVPSPLSYEYLPWMGRPSRSRWWSHWLFWNEKRLGNLWSRSKDEQSQGSGRHLFVSLSKNMQEKKTSEEMRRSTVRGEFSVRIFSGVCVFRFASKIVSSSSILRSFMKSGWGTQNLKSCCCQVSFPLLLFYHQRRKRHGNDLLLLSLLADLRSCRRDLSQDIFFFLAFSLLCPQSLLWECFPFFYCHASCLVLVFYRPFFASRFSWSLSQDDPDGSRVYFYVSLSFWVPFPGFVSSVSSLSLSHLSHPSWVFMSRVFLRIFCGEVTSCTFTKWVYIYKHKRDNTRHKVNRSERE